MPKTISTDIGKHFIVGLLGPELSSIEEKLLADLRPSGIILFAHNIDKNCAGHWIEKLQNLISRTKTLVGNESLIVSVDHEGGNVHRFPEPVTRFPPAKYWREKTSAVATAMARELRSMSFNLSYSPVLDVDSEPSNPVIGNRAFSENVDEVTAFGRAFIEALHAEGVMSCGKHFPGHGATTTDSHHELPRLECPLNLLETREMAPFRALTAQLPMIMMAHVCYAALDDKLPASLSSRVIVDQLREKLKFAGVVISDDTEMDALKEFSPSDLAVKAIDASVDLLLVGNKKNVTPLERALEMARGIEHAKAIGLLDADRLAKSAQRIDKFLEKASSASDNAAPEPSANILGCVEHRELQEEIARNANP